MEAATTALVLCEAALCEHALGQSGGIRQGKPRESTIGIQQLEDRRDQHLPSSQGLHEDGGENIRPSDRVPAVWSGTLSTQEMPDLTKWHSHRPRKMLY